MGKYRRSGSRSTSSSHVLDAPTQHHLDAWLDRCVYPEDVAKTRADIHRALREEPDLIERNLTWREIADRGALDR